MRVAIVHERLMGNTRQVAEAIADGVREAVPGADVVCASAGQTGTVEADLLIVGAPAHFLACRAQAPPDVDQWAGRRPASGASARDLEPDAAGPGVREWLDTVQSAAAHAVGGGP